MRSVFGLGFAWLGVWCSVGCWWFDVYVGGQGMTKVLLLSLFSISALPALANAEIVGSYSVTGKLVAPSLAQCSASDFSVRREEKLLTIAKFTCGDLSLPEIKVNTTGADNARAGSLTNAAGIVVGRFGPENLTYSAYGTTIELKLQPDKKGALNVTINGKIFRGEVKKLEKRSAVEEPEAPAATSGA